MSSDAESILTKEEKRRIQLREAQRRYYDNHKKKQSPSVPVSYNLDNIRSYHKSYYEKNREAIIARSKDRYYKMKQAVVPVVS